jgi:hypothetical protein
MREERLDALITVDRNLQFQQNVPASGIVVVVLQAPTNRLIHLRPLAPAVIELLATAKPGNVYRLGD